MKQASENKTPETGAVYVSLFLFIIVLFGSAAYYGPVAVFDEGSTLVATTYDAAGNVVSTSNDADNLLGLPPPEDNSGTGSTNSSSGNTDETSTDTSGNTYDAAGNLLSTDSSGSDSGDDTTHADSYGNVYDAAGNLLSESIDDKSETGEAATEGGTRTDSAGLTEGAYSDTENTMTEGKNVTESDISDEGRDIERESEHEDDQTSEKESLYVSGELEQNDHLLRDLSETETPFDGGEENSELDAILTDIEENWRFDDSFITDIEFDDDTLALFDGRPKPVDISRISVQRRETDLDSSYNEDDENVRELIDAMKGEVLTEHTLFEKREREDLRSDSDEDGISDYDEIAIYHTNPFNPHTVPGELSDGEKVRRRIDPLSEEEHTIPFENPRTSGGPTVNNYIVESLKVTGTTTSPLLQEEVADKLTFTGRGLPDSFVTLYIFSTPVIVTVETDNEGKWSYELDRELPDGEHEMYVATVDNSGKIVAKSSPVPFVKVANAAALGTSLGGPQTGTSIRSSFVMIVVTVSVIAILIMILLVGRNSRNRITGEEGTTDV